MLSTVPYTIVNSIGKFCLWEIHPPMPFGFDSFGILWIIILSSYSVLDQYCRKMLHVYGKYLILRKKIWEKQRYISKTFTIFFSVPSVPLTQACYTYTMFFTFLRCSSFDEIETLSKCLCTIHKLVVYQTGLLQGFSNIHNDFEHEIWFSIFIQCNTLLRRTNLTYRSMILPTKNVWKYYFPGGSKLQFFITMYHI